jgi:hypothetical protein
MLVSNHVVNQGEGTLILLNNAMGTDSIISLLGNYDAFVVVANQNCTMVVLTFPNDTRASYILNWTEVLSVQQEGLNSTIISSTKPVNVYLGGKFVKKFLK